jgi:hypothetical protein
MTKTCVGRYPEYASNVLFAITSNYPAAEAIASLATVVEVHK